MKSFQENSIEGFVYCLNDKIITGIEFDLMEDMHGNLIVKHPDKLSYQENFYGRTSHKGCLVQNFFEKSRNHNKKLYIDIKGVDEAGKHKLIMLKDLLRNFDIQKNILVMSYQKDILEYSKRILPDIPTVYMGYVAYRNICPDCDHYLSEDIVPRKNNLKQSKIIGSWFPKKYLRHRLHAPNYLGAMYNSKKEINKYGVY